MIRYALKCAQDHSFESWFQSAAGFDVLQKAGHITCPECGATDVKKALMAPPVRVSDKAPRPPQNQQMPQSETADAGPAPAGAGAPNAPAAMSLPDAPLPMANPNAAPLSSNPLALSAAEKAMAELRQKIEASSDYVGEDFARQARAMHLGDLDARPIYGETNLKDAKSLIEDGVSVVPLPFSPRRKTN